MTETVIFSVVKYRLYFYYNDLEVQLYLTTQYRYGKILLP